jgi:hypothetical protein
MIQQDAMLKTDYGSSFAAAFREFTLWNLYVGAAADASHYANGAAYPLPAMTQSLLPYTSPKLLVFHASAQYFLTPAGANTQVGALLASADPTQTDGLDLLLAVRHNGKIAATLTSPDVRAAALLPTASGDDVIAIVVDAERTQGVAHQPYLCIGSAADLTACASAIDPDAGVPDAGQPDAGAPDSGTPDGGAALEVVPLAIGKAAGCDAFGGAPSLILLAMSLRRRSPRAR